MPAAYQGLLPSEGQRGTEGPAGKNGGRQTWPMYTPITDNLLPTFKKLSTESQSGGKLVSTASSPTTCTLKHFPSAIRADLNEHGYLATPGKATTFGIRRRLFRWGTGPFKQQRRKADVNSGSYADSAADSTPKPTLLEVLMQQQHPPLPEKTNQVPSPAAPRLCKARRPRAGGPGASHRPHAEPGGSPGGARGSGSRERAGGKPRERCSPPPSSLF